jgi:hypothetical protein
VDKRGADLLFPSPQDLVVEVKLLLLLVCHLAALQLAKGTGIGPLGMVHEIVSIHQPSRLCLSADCQGVQTANSRDDGREAVP